VVKEVQLGIRIKVDAPTAVPDIERIENAGTKMARELGKAGKAMATELDGGTAAVTKNASATAVLVETEAAATARIREMVAASIQKNSSVSDSARSMDAAAASTRRATEENASLARSLERITAQAARPVATGPVGTSSEEATKYVASLQRQYDMLGKNSSELAQYEARMLGGTKATQQQAAALAANTSALQARIAAEQRTGQAADAFIARLKEQNATLGMNRTQLLTYQAAQLGVSNEAAPMIARLREASEAAKGHGASIDGATKATHKFGFQTAQSKKELVVLAHELSQGRYNAFGGSIMVLAEQTGAASFLFSAAGLSILAVVAAIAVLATAVVKGTMEVRTLNHDLLVTGNYAGVSAGGILNLSASISEITHNAGKATDILTGLTASGRFTGDAFVLTGEAAAYMAKLTGDSAKSVVKEFERMDQGVEKFAFEFDKKYHMIGTAILENISMLEKSQQKQEAESLAAGTIAEVARERLVTMRAHLSDGQKAWADLGDSALAAWDKMKKAGAIAVASAPIEAELAWRKSWKAGDTTTATFVGAFRDAFTGDNNDAEIAKLEAKLVQLKKQDEVQTALAAIQEKGEAALLAIETETKKYEKGEKKAREFMRIKKQFLDLLAANPDSKWLKGVTVNADKTQVSGGAYDELIASIEQRYKPKTQAGSDPRKTELDGEIKAAQATTAVEKEKYEQLNRLASMYHAAGQLSDEAFYTAKRANTLAIGTAEINGYGNQLDALQAFHGKTAVERQDNANKIEANEAAMIAAAQRNADQIEVIDEQERLRKIGVETASDAAKNKYLSDLDEEARKLEESNRARETSRAAVEREAVAQLDLAIAYQMQFMANQASSGATAEEIAQAPAILKFLEDQRAARQRLAQGFEQQETDKYTTKLANQAIKDWERAGNSIADSLSTAFGTGGKAIGQMFKAYSEGTAGQLRAQQQLAEARKKSDGNPDKIREINQAQMAGATAQIKSYGDMAGAAQGFFAEGSKGYEAMGAAAKVMHAAEVALTLVKGVNAVLTQGEGDPYTAFGRMAAMAAVVAALGVAIGGVSGSDATAKNRQMANGTGTVLGDSSAKSESIAHSLAIMEKNSGLGLAHTISMDSSLRQMVSGIGNLTGLLARSGVTAAGGGAAAGVQTGTTTLGGGVGKAAFAGLGAYGGALAGGAVGSVLTMGVIGSAPTLLGAIGGPIGMAVGAVLGSLLGGVVSKLFGTSTSIKDQGITGKAMSLGNVDAVGFTAQAYADVNTKKKAFGISYSSKDSTQTAALSNEMNQQFSMIITSMGQTVRSAADALGLGGDEFNAKLNSFVVDLGKISLKDLTGEEQQKALETAFSKMGDDMARWGVAGLQQYQAVGEGYLETLARVANDYMQVTDVLAVLGKSFSTTGLGAVALSEHLIEVSGGIEKLTSGTGFFVQNFLSEAERMAPITKSVHEAMAKLGLAGVTTTDAFKAAVLSAADGVAVGRAGAAELYASLLALAEPFKTAADYAAELAAATGEYAAVVKTASEIATEHRDLQQQLNELTKSETELLALQRAGIADVNKALFDQVQAAKAVVSAKDALAKAYDTEAAAAKTALDKSKSWVTTLNGLNASTALGNQSILTPEQKYAEARAQFEKTLAAANAGDTTAQSGLSAAEQAFLTASQVVNASDAKYAADYARVMAANNEALKWASAQVNVQQASLDALNAQVSGLITVNDSVLTVAQAIVNLQAAMGVSNGLGVKFTNAPAIAAPAALSNVPAPVVFDAMRYSAGSNVGSDALVAEIRALNAKYDAQTLEMKGVRADLAKQTGATIQATVESNDKAAKTVVAGVDKSAKASIWAQQVGYSR
jgi:hypothetical protein